MKDLLDPEDGSGRSARATGEVTGDLAGAVATSKGAAVAAFAAFYRAQVSGLVRFLIWMGAGLPDAADVAQDTMIEAFHAWQRIEHPRAWIRRVASRKYGRRLVNVEMPIDSVDGRPLVPAHRDIADWEQHHEIQRLLALLPPRQRQVMAWIYDGYQPHEIAAELGITAEAVRGSLKLARRTLARHLPVEDDPR